MPGMEILRKGLGLFLVLGLESESVERENHQSKAPMRLVNEHHRSPSQLNGRRCFSVADYNDEIDSISLKGRYSLLRGVYEDMALVGVKPIRHTFQLLVVGSFRGGRLQDALFFTDEMKGMGLVPEVGLFNILIALYGKCKNSDCAIRVLDEMKVFEVKPVEQTYVCLLNACAAAGHLDRVYEIICEMTKAGLGLNKFCYAGLITAHKNKKPVSEDFAARVIEFVERSKEWTSVDGSVVPADNYRMFVFPDELYNLPTAEYAFRLLGFVNWQLTVYHAAFHACAELKNVALMESLLEMFGKEGKTPDTFIEIQIMRCYLRSGDIDRGLKVFEDCKYSEGAQAAEIHKILVEGVMIGYTPKGMLIARKTLVKMASRGLLRQKVGSDLLLAASGERMGDYTVANCIWDLMQYRKQTPSLPAVEAYYKGLKVRRIPKDDPHLRQVSRIYDKLRKTPDTFNVTKTMRRYLRYREFDRGLKVFEDCLYSDRAQAAILHATLVKGVMIGYTRQGMLIARNTLAKMASRGLLSQELGSDLLLAASGERRGDYTVANYIWDLMQERKLTPSLRAVEAYYKGLKVRRIPEDDPRLIRVSRIYDNLQRDSKIEQHELLLVKIMLKIFSLISFLYISRFLYQNILLWPF